MLIICCWTSLLLVCKSHDSCWLQVDAGADSRAVRFLRGKKGQSSLQSTSASDGALLVPHSPAHPYCQDQVSCPISARFGKLALPCDQVLEPALGTPHIFSVCSCLGNSLSALPVLNATIHQFLRHNLQPIFSWVYCYSAVSNVSPPRNTVLCNGLISYCTAINDSMWLRAPGLKIWLL